MGGMPSSHPLRPAALLIDDDVVDDNADIWPAVGEDVNKEAAFAAALADAANELGASTERAITV